MTKAIVKRDLEAFDGTKIKKGETVDVYFASLCPECGKLIITKE